MSIFLVVSYMRLVIDRRFAFEGCTGLSITILCIITLFIVMQFTGRVDWEELFRKRESRVV